MDTTTPTRAVAAAGGQALRAAARALSLRPAAKPLHPQGSVTTARLHRVGGEGTGVEWLDEPGEELVTIRLSRSIGLPAGVPDIRGLAMRVPVGDGHHGDVLLASTGLGRLTRFTLTVAREPWGRPMTTLLPYRSPSGPLLLAAWDTDAGVDLAWSRLTGRWRTFGHIELDPDALEAPDAEISFDPVRNPVPGLEHYPWARVLREPAYATARRARTP